MLICRAVGKTSKRLSGYTFHWFYGEEKAGREREGCVVSHPVTFLKLCYGRFFNNCITF